MYLADTSGVDYYAWGAQVEQRQLLVRMSRRVEHRQQAAAVSQH
jgi:hypothetical protein